MAVTSAFRDVCFRARPTMICAVLPERMLIDPSSLRSLAVRMIRKNPFKRLASQVFGNIGVFPFGKMKTADIIQYQGCYERAMSPSERTKKIKVYYEIENQTS